MRALLLLLLTTATAPEPPAAPSPALLEFLGRFEDADGEWLDPLTLADGAGGTPAPEPSATGDAVSVDRVQAADSQPRNATDGSGEATDEGPGDGSNR